MKLSTDRVQLESSGQLFFNSREESSALYVTGYCVPYVAHLIVWHIGSKDCIFELVSVIEADLNRWLSQNRSTYSKIMRIDSGGVFYGV